MSLKVTVKVGSVNNLSDARYCAGMGVDLIGFDFSPSKTDQMTIEKFQEISEWLSGVEFVAEFTETSVSDIEQVISETKLDAIQIDNIDLVNQLVHLQKKLILSQQLHQIDNVPSGLSIDYLIISGDEAINQKNLQTIKSLADTYDILIGTGITADNAEATVYDTNTKGINLKGGDEIRPGFKDYDELADILEELEEEI